MESKGKKILQRCTVVRKMTRMCLCSHQKLSSTQESLSLHLLDSQDLFLFILFFHLMPPNFGRAHNIVHQLCNNNITETDNKIKLEQKKTK